MARVPDIVTPLKAVWGMYHRTERGVKLFALFVILFAIGLLLLVAGHPFPAAVCDILAFASLLAMAITTPPHVLERRRAEAEAAKAASEEVDSEDEDSEPATNGRDRSEQEVLSLDAETAPTSSRREIKPPLEAPIEAPPEVASMDEGEEEEGGPSSEDVGEAKDKDLWI